MRRALVLVPLIALACPASRAGFPWTLATTGSPQDVAGVTTIQPYDRQRARVLARRVQRATRANLDLAAYHANVLIRQPLVGDPITPGRARVPERPFDGALERESIVASIDQTPLTVEEKRRPLAFAPLVDYLARWNAEQAAGLEEARAAVRGESWGLPRRPGTSFQQIALLYVHDGSELWVKVELEPWARLFEELPDEDGDGFPEIYGRLKASLAAKTVLERIRADYTGRVLSTAEVHAWANELASYWYPSYNTDVVGLQGARRWPLASVEPEVRKASAGQTVDRPTVVIRGKPQGKAIYTVLAVAGIAPLDGKQAGAAAPPPAALKAAPVSPEPGPLRQAIEAELKAHGGSFAAWAAELAPTHAALRAELARRPEALKALVGRQGFLFYRRSLDYIVGGDIQAQPPNKNPLRAIVEFKDYLARLGVDFLLVPVPTKAEVFPDRLPGVAIDRPQVLSPFGRKFLLELARAGVEVVDLLPRYLEARGTPGKGEEPLYQPQDTHWTDRGLRLAAGLIAKRIRRYPWWSELAETRVAFTLKRTRFTRQGDLVSRLLEKEQRRFRPARLVAHQVLTPAGELYEDDAASPIVVLGDSFTGVYERTDCGSAGVSAHIAHAIQHPVDLVMSYGGGPNVRNKLLSRDEKVLARMRLVVWLFAARDFFNYWDDWAPLEKKR